MEDISGDMEARIRHFNISVVEVPERESRIEIGQYSNTVVEFMYMNPQTLEV